MTTAADASIAAALVEANLAFVTITAKRDDQDVRLFQVPFTLTNGTAVKVTGYIGGALLTVLAPIRITSDAAAIQAKRREMGEVLAKTLPMVRVMPHFYEGEPDAASLCWVEASVPVPPRSGPLATFLAVTPFQAVATAVEFAFKHFDGLAEAKDANIPVLLSGRGAPTEPGA